MPTEFTKEAFTAGVMATTGGAPPSFVRVEVSNNGAPLRFVGVRGVASGAASTSGHASPSGLPTGGPSDCVASCNSSTGGASSSTFGLNAGSPVRGSYVDALNPKKKPPAADWSSMMGNY